MLRFSWATAALILLAGVLVVAAPADTAKYPSRILLPRSL
jgi:hypothetical protein